MSSEEVN